MEDKLQRQGQTSPETVADRRWAVPRVDIYENENEVLLLADVPGVDKDNLSINLDNNELTLEGRSASGDGDALRMEYVPVDYRRSFLLPGGVDARKISADLEQGVLWLHLPKSEDLKPRTIPVKGE